VLDEKTKALLDTLNHSVGDSKVTFNINQFFDNGGNTYMTTNDNSTTISGGNVSGNQFGAGSKDFKGVINNITKTEEQKLENLTENLIKALSEEKDINGANPDEVVDAINQVREEATKKSVNKLSLNGILSGINMVMQNVTNISDKTKMLYTQWHEHINNLFN